MRSPKNAEIKWQHAIASSDSRGSIYGKPNSRHLSSKRIPESLATSGLCSCPRAVFARALNSGIQVMLTVEAPVTSPPKSVKILNAERCVFLRCKISTRLRAPSKSLLFQKGRTPANQNLRTPQLPGAAPPPLLWPHSYIPKQILHYNINLTARKLHYTFCCNPSFYQHTSTPCQE